MRFDLFKRLRNEVKHRHMSVFNWIVCIILVILALFLILKLVRFAIRLLVFCCFIYCECSSMVQEDV